MCMAAQKYPQGARAMDSQEVEQALKVLDVFQEQATLQIRANLTSCINAGERLDKLSKHLKSIVLRLTNIEAKVTDIEEQLSHVEIEGSTSGHNYPYDEGTQNR